MKHEEARVPVEDKLAETMSNVELTPRWTSTAARGWTAINGKPVSSSDRSSASDTVMEISRSNRSSANDTGLEISVSIVASLKRGANPVTKDQSLSAVA